MICDVWAVGGAMLRTQARARSTDGNVILALSHSPTSRQAKREKRLPPSASPHSRILSYLLTTSLFLVVNRQFSCFRCHPKLRGILVHGEGNGGRRRPEAQATKATQGSRLISGFASAVGLPPRATPQARISAARPEVQRRRGVTFGARARPELGGGRANSAGAGVRGGHREQARDPQRKPRCAGCCACGGRPLARPGAPLQI